MAKQDVTHSPGPWRACHDGKCSCGGVWTEPGDYEVAVVTVGEWGDTYPAIEDGKPVIKMCAYGSVSREVATANARLIAAAPDLLALARKCASECAECAGTGIIIGTLPSEPCPDCADIWAVIRRAEGRS